MKNCLAFCTHTLPAFILELGIWNIIDVFRQFKITTDVLTLDKHLLETEDVNQMKFAATINDQGLWTNRTTENIILHLTNMIAQPGTVEEVTKINSALKVLCIKKFGNTSKFYGLMSEGINRRMLFQKMCQLAGPLEDEIATNTEFLIMLVNRKLVDLDHLHQLSSFTDRSTKIAHYIIQNINHYHRLKTFLYIVQNWCVDKNLIELMEEIAFDVELVQSPHIEKKITEDMRNRICDIY